MKKKYLFMLGMFFFSGATNLGWAFSVENHWSVSLAGGIVRFPYINVIDQTREYRQTSMPDTGWMGSLSAVYGVSPSFQLGMSLEYLNVATEYKDRLEVFSGDSSGNYLSVTTEELCEQHEMPTGILNFVVRGAIPLGERFNLVPSIGLGLAATYYHYRLYIGDKEFLQDDLSHTNFGVNCKPAVGAEFLLTDLISLSAEIGYRALVVFDFRQKLNRNYDNLSGPFSGAAVHFNF
ncbi:MAG: outer membrane beta-barrel protein [Candidatus Firestonebacteria bacterium]|nr:outer membrane beta-barrel protein [Candidatus Firestonebacteria bacterium]